MDYNINDQNAHHTHQTCSTNRLCNLILVSEHVLWWVFDESITCHLMRQINHSGEVVEQVPCHIQCTCTHVQLSHIHICMYQSGSQTLLEQTQGGRVWWLWAGCCDTMECNCGHIVQLPAKDIWVARMSYHGLHNNSSIYDLIGSADIPAGVTKTYPVSPDPMYVCIYAVGSGNEITYISYWPIVRCAYRSGRIESTPVLIKICA